MVSSSVSPHSALSSDFFYDPVFLHNITDRSLQEIRAHTIILGSDVEGFLKVAALIDGSTVDFVFGLRPSQRTLARSRANEVKRFVRSLDSREQEAVARFYLSLYEALASYQEGKEAACACLFESQMRRGFDESVDRAFTRLSKDLRGNTQFNYD
jgi:hypothetical protein